MAGIVEVELELFEWLAEQAGIAEARLEQQLELFGWLAGLEQFEVVGTGRRSAVWRAGQLELAGQVGAGMIVEG